MGQSLLPPQPVIYLVEPFGGSVRRQNANMPHVFWDDAAVTRGDGIFETILIRGGRPVNLGKHLDRFRRSAGALNLPDPGGEHWITATREAVADYCRERGDAAPDTIDAACVWTMTRGRETTGVPTAWLTVRPPNPEFARQRKHGVSVMTTGRGFTINRDEAAVPWLALGAKTLNYAATMGALRWARDHGYDDVIYIDPATGRVLEGATSTVLVVKRGSRLRTPAAGPDILPGTTQQAIFEYATENGWRCKKKPLHVDDLATAESVWLVSSVRRGVRVTAVDGTPLPAPGNEKEIAGLIDAALAAATG
ncbi:aminodeoxychorismate lyase [Corynebacterium sp. UBA2622]|uniref:aminodeoxychorismate lyase n=1 Tax=Corynebacterium sp. UBA2622 TaxID=1946393 RepID=UPI0025BC0D45|nr:aminodeoxychorismate lyase [Corynebacterium sp. UBA2622]